MNAKNIAFLLVPLVLFLHACQGDKGKDIPDVSDIPVEVELKRFDRDLFSLDTNNMASTLPKLETDYGEFAEIFFNQVMGSKDPRVAPEGHANYVRGFITHPSVQKLYDTTQVVFPDTRQLEMEFRQAFQFFRYYFPAQPLSGEIVTYISEYTLGGFLYDDNSIAVGLDFYLGEQYPYQAYLPANPNFSKYLTRTFNKDHIVLKSMKMLVQDILGPPPGDRLIDYMIHNGKELYLLDKLLPNAPDSIRLEYSQPQVDWVNDNEANIWAFLISEDLLYSSELGKFRKLIEYSPNSPGMPDQAPGRTASWLGWQIVMAYMKKNPQTTLDELINLRDAQALMDGSRYKPERR